MSNFVFWNRSSDRIPFGITGNGSLHQYDSVEEDDSGGSVLSAGEAESLKFGSIPMGYWYGLTRFLRTEMRIPGTSAP